MSSQMLERSSRAFTLEGFPKVAAARATTRRDSGCKVAWQGMIREWTVSGGWWGVCIICYFYAAACGPKGHGSGLPPPGGNGGFYMTVSCPRSK